MITKEYRTLGYTLPFEVAASVEEYNKSAWKADNGEGNPCLDSGNDNTIYRGSLAEWRELFLHGREQDKEKNLDAIAGIEEQTGIDRKVKPALNAKGEQRKDKDGDVVTTYDETQDEYWKRVQATLVEQKKFSSEEAVRAHYEPFAKEMAALVKFDAAAREKAATGPRKLAQKFKLTAARILAAGTVAKANANYLVNIGKEFVPTGDTSKTYKATYEVLDPTTKKPTGKTAELEVSDADAEALGWLLKEHSEWKTAQEQLAMVTE